MLTVKQEFSRSMSGNIRIEESRYAVKAGKGSWAGVVTGHWDWYVNGVVNAGNRSYAGTLSLENVE